MRTTSYSIGSGFGVGFGLRRGTGGGGGNCLSFCADPFGVTNKLIAPKRKASAAINSAGFDRLGFCKCINQLLMPPANIVAGKANYLTPTGGMIVGDVC